MDFVRLQIQEFIIKRMKIEKILIILTVHLLYQNTSQELVGDACIQFQQGQCTRCKRQTHLYLGICYRNILGCIQYQNGNQCVRCESGNYKLVNKTCQTVKGVSKSLLRNDLYKYSGTFETNPGDQFGQSSFIPSSYEVVHKWPTFETLDNFIRKGQYRHYISRMSNPVYSVHYYISQKTYSYKLLYHGSGGGLFLCIADIPPSLNVELRSLTPISASNVVINCYDYDTAGKCVGCSSKYHLQKGRCYLNYGGCIRYQQNLCTQCLDYYFLVQNRCTSDCLSSSDSRSILHYGLSRKISTMQSFYGLSITSFYTITFQSYQIQSFIRRQNITLPANTRANQSLYLTQDRWIETSFGDSSKMNQNIERIDMAKRQNITKNVERVQQKIEFLPLSFSKSNSSTIEQKQTRVQPVLRTKNSSVQKANQWTKNMNNGVKTNTVNQNNISLQTLSKNIEQQSNWQSMSTKSSRDMASKIQDLNNQNWAASNNAHSNFLHDITNIAELNQRQAPPNYQALNNLLSSLAASYSLKIDPNCQNTVNARCLKCNEFFFINQQGVCQEISFYCAELNEQGECGRCFSGYTLTKGRCEANTRS